MRPGAILVIEGDITQLAWALFQHVRRSIRLSADAQAAAGAIFAFRLPADSGPWGMPALCALMIAAGLTASWLPARRALRVPTSDALRAE